MTRSMFQSVQRAAPAILIVATLGWLAVGIAFGGMGCTFPPYKCNQPLPGGGSATVKCTITCTECFTSYGGLPCATPGDRYQACMKVCNTQGVVVGVACVCGCLTEDPPTHPNCVATP